MNEKCVVPSSKPLRAQKKVSVKQFNQDNEGLIYKTKWKPKNTINHTKIWQQLNNRLQQAPTVALIWHSSVTIDQKWIYFYNNFSIFERISININFDSYFFTLNLSLFEFGFLLKAAFSIILQTSSQNCHGSVYCPASNFVCIFAVWNVPC